MNFIFYVTYHALWLQVWSLTILGPKEVARTRTQIYNGSTKYCVFLWLSWENASKENLKYDKM